MALEANLDLSDQVLFHLPLKPASTSSIHLKMLVILEKKVLTMLAQQLLESHQVCSSSVTSVVTKVLLTKELDNTLE